MPKPKYCIKIGTGMWVLYTYLECNVIFLTEGDELSACHKRMEIYLNERLLVHP